jgi:periplasmic divalent cation tolerance protein
MAKKSHYYFVYMTFGDLKEATEVSKILVKENLAACTNIIKGMQSVYAWQGKIIKDKEVVVIAKTEKAKLSKLEKLVKKLHSYDNPCIVWIPVDGGSATYLQWLDRSLNP